MPEEIDSEEIYDVAILGAGPVGLEAALRAADAGYKTIVLERGEVAQNVRDWGHVKMFTPFGMNSSERGRAVVKEATGECPGEEEVLTGRELAHRYFSPLADTLRGRVSLVDCTQVTRVMRVGWSKSIGIGDFKRAIANFQIEGISLSLPRRGQNRAKASFPHPRAKVVVDATGLNYYEDTMVRGSAGADLCAEGERHVLRGPLDPEGFLAELDLSGRRVLLVGSGHTAMTDLVRLTSLDVNVTWVTRRDGELPVKVDTTDPLPDRRNLVSATCDLVASGKVEWIGGHVVESLNHPLDDTTGLEDDEIGDLLEAPVAAAVVRSLVTGETKRLDGPFHEVIADIGFRPNTSLFSELQVHLCYATEGPMKLAANLMSQDGQGGGDCLSQTGSDASLLETTEPGFFILGAKSYGRRSNFLLKAGIEQVQAAFDELVPAHLERVRKGRMTKVE